MGFGIKVRIKGDYACFTRPEMKAERVSYDVPTPSAVRGILESVYWKPAIKWVVKRIIVLNEIKFSSIVRNEFKSKAPVPSNALIEEAEAGDGKEPVLYASDERTQRTTLYLKDVDYVVEAYFDEVPDKKGERDSVQKHYNIMLRRLRHGQFYKKPSLGLREFSCDVSLIEDGETVPKSVLSGSVDLGYMLYDMEFKQGRQGEYIDEDGRKFPINYSNDATPVFYRPKMVDGIIEVEKYYKEKSNR